MLEFPSWEEINYKTSCQPFQSQSSHLSLRTRRKIFLTIRVGFRDATKTSKLKEQIEHESTPKFASARL